MKKYKFIAITSIFLAFCFDTNSQSDENDGASLCMTDTGTHLVMSCTGEGTLCNKSKQNVALPKVKKELY